MKRKMAAVLMVLAVPGLAVVSCDETPQAPPSRKSPTVASCAKTPVFAVSPVASDDIASIVVLGNLNPPGHTFPTDHVYVYLRIEGGASVTVETGLFAPGDMILTAANAFEHVNAGLLDFSVTMECGTVTLNLGHVTTLAANLFGSTSDLSSWELLNEYTTGGETYRMYRKSFDRAVQAGDSLGTTGGNPGQWALDIGTYDSSSTSGVSANPSRWQDSWYEQAVCPLDFYETGPVADALWALVDRSGVAIDPYPCGRALQDVPGTAQGCWFLEGVAEPYPEDKHLALAWSNTRPANAVISAGAMIATLSSGAYAFVPQSAGRLNRDFSQVTPDGMVYGYTPVGLANGVVIVEMPDSMTLLIEHLPAGTADPATWYFTPDRTRFER